MPNTAGESHYELAWLEVRSEACSLGLAGEKWMPKAPGFVWSVMEMRFGDCHSVLAEGERKPKGYLCWYGGEKGFWNYSPEWHGGERMVLGCSFGCSLERWSWGCLVGCRRFGGVPICCRKL